MKQKESSVDTCAGAIREAILRGDLAPGARLPPERALAAQFGVNRLTVRAALARLSTVGLVTVRQGSGYRVEDFHRRGGPDLLPGLAELARAHGGLRELVADLLLVRRHIARAVLERLASGGAGGARSAAVIAAIDRFAAAVAAGADLDALAAADLAVAAALLDATGSPVLQLCLNPVQAVLADLPALRAAIYADPSSNVAGYRVLAHWLAAPRADAIDLVAAELARRDAVTLDRLQLER